MPRNGVWTGVFLEDRVSKGNYFRSKYRQPNSIKLMANDFSHLNRDEQLRAENEFLKMKLMLEKGAQFGITGEMERLPAEIENKFLKHIMEFEEQAAQPVTATVFETLNKPSHFKPVQEIPEDQIDQAWKELSAYLKQHSVRLDV